MAAPSSDDEEQQPLVDDNNDNRIMEEEDKEEEKQELLRNEDGDQYTVSQMDEDESFEKEHDITHSSLLLCRITIFYTRLYQY